MTKARSIKNKVNWKKISIGLGCVAIGLPIIIFIIHFYFLDESSSTFRAMMRIFSIDTSVREPEYLGQTQVQQPPPDLSKEQVSPKPLAEYDEETRAVLQTEPFTDGWLIDENRPGQVAVPFYQDQVITSNFDNGYCSQNINPEITRLKESYTIIEDRSYRDYWHRLFIVYLPRITDEIKDQKVARAINSFFESKLADELKKYQSGEYGLDFSLVDNNAINKIWYWCNDYTANFIGNYFAVEYHYGNYDGGAHGMRGVTNGYNFDLTTGKLLTLADIFESADDYVTAVDQAITNYDGGSRSYHSVTDFYPGTLTDEIPFVLTKQGIVFFFNPYELGPYAEGIIEITVPYGQTLISL